MNEAAPAPSGAPSAATSSAAAADDRGNRLKRLAAIAAVAVAAVLISIKGGAWLATGSVSLLSSLIDSLLDLAASLINLVAIRQAAQPADREHRFGHGKAEPLAGLAQAAFVCGSAAFLIFEAVQRLVQPREIAHSTLGIGVMVFSIVLTIALVLFQRRVIRATGSVAIGADQLHYRADLLVNLGVIAALAAAAEFGWTAADPIAALAIAAYIITGAYSVFRSSLDLLMDKELGQADRDRIREIATAHPGVMTLHDLRTRSSGTHTFIQFHLELDGNLTLYQAHAIADEVMSAVQLAFPAAEVLIHEDPFGIQEDRAEFE